MFENDPSGGGLFAEVMDAWVQHLSDVLGAEVNRPSAARDHLAAYHRYPNPWAKDSSEGGLS